MQQGIFVRSPGGTEKSTPQPDSWSGWKAVPVVIEEAQLYRLPDWPTHLDKLFHGDVELIGHFLAQRAHPVIETHLFKPKWLHNLIFNCYFYEAAHNLHLKQSYRLQQLALSSPKTSNPAQNHIPEDSVSMKRSNVSAPHPYWYNSAHLNTGATTSY